jgi:hypothetical protein
MIDDEDGPVPRFTTSSWSSAGIATLDAVGHDARSALEAGLQAVLALTVVPEQALVDTRRSAPIRGAGNELGSLFADLLEDFLEQIEFFGGGLHDVAVDGVLRRDDGGYVSWGQAFGTLDAASPVVVPHLLGSPTASEGAAHGVIIHASLQRS